ncbi:MAG: ribose 5-phosphate isomerase [Thermoplasmata archaeon]|nr:ribose 5-phosphate isomerase [Thermoplasmata archaeon]MEA3166842.1 ribose 5-phosphate isomerase [Thermoplasmata archaeon]
MQGPVRSGVADREALKRKAGEAAAELVQDGMVVGLGTGSTVRYFIEALGKRVAAGLKVQGIPTSESSAKLARSLGIPLTSLDEKAVVDLTVDGADEFDAQLRLIKGGGGALTREKIVAKASKRMVVVADEGKQVKELGSTFPLPIECIAIAKAPLMRRLQELGATAKVREVDGKPFLTDNGHLVVDAKFARIEYPEAIEQAIETMPGVLACGLFLGLCESVLVGTEDGVRTVKRA